ncbi:MAG: Ti-type conjugative transfer relaxase TraA [Coxiellaceae bacterium]|nr:Ti-type conjugative transfer relaxase TraA [Coxiellaceae bacterium]
MAIYHFSVQVISRNQGRSSIASAAYRSAEKLMDERTGLTHDFTKKSDVIEKDILLPSGAPEWMSDREKLWNGVEQTEKRKDSQLAREINIALPRELSPEQNWDLLKSFVQTEFVDNGMVADVAFHRGHKGGEDQPHGHVMLTMREVTQEGFGQKVRAWNDKALLNDWREHWAERCNLELARHGFDLRVDHRTLEAQGINLEAQSKIGPKEAQRAMARFSEHQALAERNGERLLKEPEIALAAITRQQSTFTHQDLARLVNRHTVDAAQFDAVYAKVKSHPELVLLGQDDRGRDRFTTQELLALETKMINQVTENAQSTNHLVSDKHMAAAMVDKNLSGEQQAALKHLTQGGDIVCVVGFAGTGKSYMLGAAREAWEAQGYHVQGMTLSGIAAENLEGGSGIVSGTVASRLWHWERDRERLTSKDIVVVDEAGMLGSRQMAKIIEEVHCAGAKVALVGDPEQLQAIEAGAAYRAIAERVGFVEMTDIRRQIEAWQQQATRDFASSRTADGLLAYEQHDNVHTFNTKDSAMIGMIEEWDEVRSQSLDKSQIMLAYTRDEVRQLNEQARTIRRSQGELGQDHTVETSRGQRTFAEQDRIYFLRNDNRELHVKNGTLGTIEKINDDKLIVSLDHGDREKARRFEFSLKDYNDIDHGYAATVYKAQGVTVDRTHVLASKYFDRHSTYVAISRHREGADLYVSRDDFPSFSDLSKTLSRERTKDVTLDYSIDRGFDVSEDKRIKDRTTDQQKIYSVNLTEDRLASAEKRLAQRQYEKAMQADISELQKKTGLSYSMELQEGDRGVYRGMVEIAGRRYGVLEQEQGSAKLIEASQIESQQKDKAMMIEKHTNYRGQEKLKAFQPEVRQRERSRDRGIDYGGL